MVFTMTDWKARLADSLQAWRAQLERAKPESVYVTLVAISLRPLLQAA